VIGMSERITLTLTDSLHSFGQTQSRAKMYAAKTPPSPLGIRLRQLRRAAGLKQLTLAKRAGVCRSLVAAIEAGHRGKRPALNTVERLAAALGLTVAQLADGESPADGEPPLTAKV
jgi:DNA-binding XRE family transcriptional regulator